MGESLESIKQLIRSVLLSSKAGVVASRLQGDYQELCGGYIPHTKFGFSNLQDFLASLNDVVRIGRNSNNQITYFAIADESTKHIQALVSKQKSKPKKKAPPSFSRNQIFSKPFVKPRFQPNKSFPVKKYPPSTKYSKKSSYQKSFKKENSENLKQTSNNKFSNLNNTRQSKKNNSKETSEMVSNGYFKKSLTSPSKVESHKNQTKQQTTYKAYKGKNKQNAFDYENDSSQTDFIKSSTTPGKSSPTKYKKTSSSDSSEAQKNLSQNNYYSKKSNNFHQSKLSNKKSSDVKSKAANGSNKGQFPRFSRKSSKTDPSECNLYDNPLGSSPIKDGDRNANALFTDSSNAEELGETTAFDEHDSLSLETSDNIFVNNLKKLLSIYKGGLHLSGVARLYKNTYQEDIPQSILDDIVNSVIDGCATVEKVNITGDNKYILFPYSEKVSNSESIPIANEVKLHNVLNLGEDYEVKVTYSSTCEKIYVQLTSDFELLLKMLDVIKNAWSSLPKLHVIKSESFVITHDFYRAKVLSVNKKQVEIYKIDFGDCTDSYWTSLDNLRPMPHFVAEFPQFCILCSMHRPTNDLAEKWTLASAEAFAETYADHSLILTTIGVSMVKINEAMDSQYQHNVIFYKGAQQFKSNINAKLLQEEKLLKSAIQNCCDPFEHQPKNFAVLPNEEICNLFVFAVSCTTEVEVCIIGSGFSDKLAQLETKMFEFYSNSSLNHKLPSPPPCNCMYAILSKENCTRCRLTSIENDREGTVYLVDNGESEKILLENLRPLTEEFSQLPLQSINVCLAGLDHGPLSTHCSILQKLNETVVHQTCTARVIGKMTKSSKVVSIIELFSSSEISLNQICFDMIVDESLIPMLPASDDFSAVSIGSVDVENSLIFLRLAGEGMVKLNECLSELSLSLDRQNRVNVYPGKQCLVLLANGLHRARVQNVYSDNSQNLSVCLIDVGISENVKQDALYRLEDETTLSIPPQAICCRLSGAVSNDVSHKFLNDVANTLTSTAALVKVESFSAGEDPDLVSLWLNDENQTQIVGTECSRPRSENSNYAKSSSNSYSRSNSELSELLVDGSSGADINENLDKDLALSPIKDFDQNLILTDIKSVANFMYHNTRSEQYKQVLYLETNPMLVQIEDAVAPDCLQIILMSDVLPRDYLSTALNNCYKKPQVIKKATDIMINRMYAFFSEDEKLWYRVRALSTIDNDVSVYLVDYGTCRATDRSFLYELDLSYSKIPDLVITAKLSGIQPLDQHNGMWPDNVSNKLRSFLKSNCYLAHVLKIIRSDPVLHRDVWEVCLNDLSNPNLWINDLIVDDWNCACYVA